MKTKFAIPMFAVLVGAGISSSASADDVLNVIVGTGFGAAFGHAVGGHDGAIVGGVVGAMVGAAASNDERQRVYETRTVYATDYPYYSAPAVVYAAPPVYYTTRVVYREPPVVRYRYRDRDHDRYHDRGWHDDGPRHDWHDGR